MNKLLALFLACAALALVAAGCGDDEDEGAGGGGEGAAETQQDTGAETTDDTSQSQDAVQVAMKDIKFDPESVTVAPGGEVTWTNEDSAPHDVTADEFKSGDPGGMKQGDKYTEKFTEAGSFKYVCTVHPGMEGTVKVE